MKKQNLPYLSMIPLVLIFLLQGCIIGGDDDDGGSATPIAPSVVACTLSPVIGVVGPDSKDISCFTTFQHTVVRTDGTVRYPPTELRVGRPDAAYLAAGIVVFELPDLNGATIASANLRFQVTSGSTMNSSFHTNLNIDALRSTVERGDIVASDFSSLGVSSPALTIQESIVLWDDALANDFETNATADDLLASWLVCQYDKVGIGGLVFLRISPDQDPVANYYMNILTTSVELIITTDGNENPVRGFGDTVSLQMGSHAFSWTFNQDVEWGYFIDGQPWVVEPAGGNLSLLKATPSRLNAQTVYKYPSTPASPVMTVADINITVKNPPISHQLVAGNYEDNPNGVFGWDSRTGIGTTSLARYNSTLGWDGTTPITLAAGDSITTPQSMTSTSMPDRASVLDALAVLTILDIIPPDDAFRPGPLREGADRTNPEIIRYSDVIDVTPYLIQNPVGVTLGLEGGSVTEIEQKYTYPWLVQQLPGPGFINSGGSPSEGISAMYNNTSYLVGSAGGSYGGYMGLLRFGPLAIGSLADWLTPDERKLCQIRLIQRAIDTYSALQAGLCIEEGAGILPGYSTMITIAGILLNHPGMIGVNDGINGVMPWFIFADYATTFHTDGVPAGDLATGEVQADRQIALFYNAGDDRPELNKKDIQPIISATANTVTVDDNFYWGDSRPIQDVINLKLRITAGQGAGNTIYVITHAADFINDNGDVFTGGNSYAYKKGGTVTVNPPWANGIPNATSIIALSITTSKPGSLASDDARWLWAVHGIIPWVNPAYIEKTKAISTSPTHNYISIQSGGTLGELIALYALDGQDNYKGGLDKFMIDGGTRPGYAELLFSGAYLSAINLYNPAEGKFRGTLWRQEVLEHPSVNKGFAYTGLGVDSLLIPDPTALMWYE